MFTIILSLLEKIGMGKYVALLIVVVAALAAGSYFTYSATKTYYVSQGDSRVLKIEDQRDKVTADRDAVTASFAAYRELQAARVRELEIRSSSEAELAQGQIKGYKDKLTAAQSAYKGSLAARKETPGVLSTSAVDAINAAIRAATPASAASGAH